MLGMGFHIVCFMMDAFSLAIVNAWTFFSMRERPINNNKGYSAAVVCYVFISKSFACRAPPFLTEFKVERIGTTL